MTQAAELEIIWGANTTAAQSSFTQMDSKVAGSSKGFGSWSSGVKASVMAAGGFVALSVGRDMVSAFSEADRVAGQSEAVIKSTGGAAGLTAQDFADLATARSKLTGIDDEAIQAEENWLATFTKVQDATGQGNDIFTQASAAIQDMATAMNQGAVPAADQLTSATTLVGKALNDPIKGLTALTRVGVSFTEKQKQQITTLVETGHAMEAQKIILGELNKEFGGSSTVDTFDRRMAKVGVTIGNLEEIGGQIIAAFLEPLGAVLTTAAPLLELVAKNALLVVSAFAGWKVIGLATSSMAKLNFALSGLSTASAGLPLLVQSIAGLSTGAIAGGVLLLAAAFTDLGFAVAAFINDPMSKLEQQVNAVSGSQEKWNSIVEESASAGRFAGAKVAALGDEYVTTTVKQQAAIDATATHSRAARELDKSLLLEKSGAAGAANAADELTTAHNKAAASALKEMRAELELAGGLLGVEGAAMSARDADDAYEAALRKVTTMAANGKKGSNAYAQALRDEHDAAFQAISAHQNLASSIEQYIIEQHKSGVTTDQAMAIIRRFGVAAGVTGADARRLAADILKILAAENALHDKTVTITYNVQGTGAPGGKVLPTASGFQGWVDRPTTFLTAEAGEREYVSITPASKMGRSKMGAAGTAPDGAPPSMGYREMRRAAKDGFLDALEEFSRRHPERRLARARDL